MVVMLSAGTCDASEMPAGLVETHNAVSLPSMLKVWVHAGLLDDASWRIGISNEYTSSSSILKSVKDRLGLLLHIPPHFPGMAHIHEACDT